MTAARGSTVLTRMPRPHNSCASALVSRLRAALDDPYIPVVAPRPSRLYGGPAESLPVALERLTIQPSPASSIAGSAACARSSGAWTFTSKVMRRRFDGISDGCAYIAAAALL